MTNMTLAFGMVSLFALALTAIPLALYGLTLTALYLTGGKAAVVRFRSTIEV